MAEEATAVNEAVAPDATTTTSAVEETPSLEVVTEGKELSPNDYRESTETTEESTEEVPTEPTTEEQPQEGEKPLAPKSENRFQKLANENRELKEQIERLQQQESQLATEQELLNEINPETNDYYTPQEVERLAFQQAREAQQQSIAQQRYELEVQHNQQIISSEAAQALQDFPMFDSNSPEFDQELAQQADQLLGQSLITDNGVLVGSNVSPYQLYKAIADSAQRAAHKAKTVGQAEAQRATEKMLANADGPVSGQPSTSSRTSEAAMTAAEYAKAHKLKKVWE